VALEAHFEQTIRSEKSSAEALDYMSGCSRVLDCADAGACLESAGYRISTHDLGQTWKICGCGAQSGQSQICDEAYAARAF